MDSVTDIETLPVDPTGAKSLLLRDVAEVTRGTMPGEYDRYNMKRTVTLTANVVGADLGTAAREVARAIARAGAPPKGVLVDVRGQLAPLREIVEGLTLGLGMSVVAIALLLTANFQSIRLAIVAVATTPAVLAGVGLALITTGTTLNLQSFMGAIMAMGVAVANAILLVTFAERARLAGATASEAAVRGARDRLRPILMTSLAMIAGMLPMALGLGEGGEQSAPLGRAVVGGLAASTLSTLLVLPSVFALMQSRAGRASASLDPFDIESVSVMAVNNELGTIQPLPDVAAAVRATAPQALLHTDAVQAVPWVDVAILAGGWDLVAISGHKFGGPKGVGVLVVRGGVPLDAEIEGGGQERGIRAGTVNVAGIVALATALRITHEQRSEETRRIGALRDRLRDGLLAAVPGAFVNGAPDSTTAGHLHVGFPGVESEALLVMMDQRELYAAAGSSCSSGATEISHVLVAMGMDRDAATSSIRLSLGYASTDADVDTALAVIPRAVAQLRAPVRR